MSYKVELLVQGEWAGNRLRFATEQEAREYASHKFSTWMLVDDTRVIETAGAVNATYDRDGVKTVVAA